MASHSSLPRLSSRFIRLLAAPAGDSPPTISGTRVASTDAASIWRIESDDPGVVAAWWVVHKTSERDLAIALVNIAKLRKGLTRNRNPFRRNVDPIQLTSRRSFRVTLNTYLAEEPDLDLGNISHMFLVAWQSRIPNENRHYKIEPVCAIPCDLQGASPALTGGDKRAINISEAMALQLLRLPVPQDESWDSFVSRLNWLGWLTDYSRHAFGPNHILQPRKATAP